MKKRIIALAALFTIITGGIPAYANNGFTTELYVKEGPTYTPPAVKSEISSTSITVTKNAVTVYVNGNKVTADNFVHDGTTYLPIRAVGDSLNANIDYDAVSKTAAITVPQNTSAPSQPAKDVQMSNYLISSIYASDMVKYMFLIKDSVDVLPSMPSEDNLNTLASDIENLRNDVALIYECKLDMLYGIAIHASNVADNAEQCLNLVKKGTASSNFEALYGGYHNNVAFNTLSSLDKLDDINADALDYALSK